VKSEFPGGPLYRAPVFSSIPDMLARAAERAPDKTFVTEPGPNETWRSITYGDMRRRVDSLAGALLRLHDRPVVGVVGRNSIDWYTAYLAALRSGGVVVPIDRQLSTAEMHTILHYSGTNIFFFDEDYEEEILHNVGEPGRKFEMFAMNATGPTESGQLEDLVASAPPGVGLPLSYDRGAPAAICYTSGTMGQAKGVVLSQGNLLANIRQMLQFLDLRADDVFLSVLPVHHTFEGTGGFLGPLAKCAEIVVCRGLRYIAEDLVQSRATIMLGVPLLWEAMYKRIRAGIRSQRGGGIYYRLGMMISAAAERLAGRNIRRKVFAPVHEKLGGRARLLISGGAGIDPQVVAGYEKLGFKFIQGYGLTECSPIVSVNRDVANRLGSVGPLLPEMEGRIERPDEEGVGELLVRGPNVMSGYHENPEETARVLSGDGWFRTGDFAYFDEDGFLFITGRKKNVIVAKNGKNVYPEEIETLINRSGLLSESMVFGMESESKGEEIWAIIVPDLDRHIERAEARGESLEPEQVVESVRKVVREYNSTQPPYRRIRSFMIREEELPKTTTRKIRRREVMREAGLEREPTYTP
jgi:long-chain acyl-CoA synthetase